MLKKNNPALPSCKTVLIPNVGMRIKGVVNNQLATTKCQVRNVVDSRGVVKTLSKQNKEKRKAKTIQDRYFVSITHNNKRKDNMLYDTGAMMTTMPTDEAQAMGITTAGYATRVANVRGAGGHLTRGTFYQNVPLKLVKTNEVARGEVFVAPNMKSLLGVSHINQYKRFRVKFIQR